MKRFALILLMLLWAIPAHAGFFLEKDAAEEEEKALEADRGFSYGGGVSATYYLGAFDLALEGLLTYRFQSDFALSANLSFGATDPVHEAGLEASRFFGPDDFLGFGASGVLFKKDGDWKKAPRIFVDYGKNMKPWPHAHFALQAKIRISYLVGESIGREETYITKTANTTISGQIALVFF